MRALALLGFAFLVLGLVGAFAPLAGASPNLPACVNPKGMYGGSATCGGLVCADTNLDGRLGGNECIYFLCPEYGCCDPGACPQPL